MTNLKCENCGLVNSSGEEKCKRCGTPLAIVQEAMKDSPQTTNQSPVVVDYQRPDYADYTMIDTDGETALMLAVQYAVQYEPEKRDALIAGGAGIESIEAAKRYILSPPTIKGMPPKYVTADGYRRLAFLYLALGDKDSALAQHKILKERADQAQDKDTKKVYESFADSLLNQLNK